MIAKGRGQWLVPSWTATRKHFFAAGERWAICGLAKRDNGRLSRCVDKCSRCVRAMKLEGAR